LFFACMHWSVMVPRHNLVIVSF